MKFEVIVICSNNSRDKGHNNLQLTKFRGKCQVFPSGTQSSDVSRVQCDSRVGMASHLDRINAFVLCHQCKTLKSVHELNLLEILQVYFREIRPKTN